MHRVPHHPLRQTAAPLFAQSQNERPSQPNALPELYQSGRLSPPLGLVGYYPAVLLMPPHEQTRRHLHLKTLGTERHQKRLQPQRQQRLRTVACRFA